MTPGTVEAVLEVLKKEKNIDLSDYRRDTVKRRISARMEVLRPETPAAYLELLRENPPECDTLLNEILINVSWFFREPLVFEIMSQTLLPEIIARKQHSKSREIRIWSLGCAAGEEAFSTAILVHHALEKRDGGWKSYIFATDIDTDALEKAKTGTYPRDSFESTKLGILDKYFIPRGVTYKTYEIRPFIKEMVFFSKEDCTSSKNIAPAESVFGTFDIVLCRNVLVYFSRKLQKKVLDKINKTMAPGAYLILGESDSLVGDMESDFVPLIPGNKIYRKSKGMRNG